MNGQVPMDQEVAWRRLSLCVVFAVAAVVLAQAVLGFGTSYQALAAGNTDDTVRLLSVRSWLGGQGWYDMTLYRVLPPEGVSLHWSRLVDAAMAGLMAPVAWIDPSLAEPFLLTAWPTLLMLALIGVTWRGTSRLMGPLAGAIAVLALWLWVPTGRTFFAPGRIDHHNLQILLTTIVGFSVVWPEHPRARGIIAALATALSLAVGLEALLLLAAMGLVLALRGLSDRDAALPAFVLTLPVAAVVLFAAQTAPSTWAVPYCDALAPPVLSVLMLASVASLLAFATPRGMGVRVGVMAAVVAVGLVLLRPLLGPCLAGPYGALPQEAQDIIARLIAEARPAHVVLRQIPLLFFESYLPVLGAVVVATLVWWSDRQLTFATWAMLGWSALGIVLTIVQVRQVLLLAPMMPFLTARGLAPLLSRRLRGPDGGSIIPLVGAVCVTLLAPMLGSTLWTTLAPPRPETTAGKILDADCRDLDVLAPLIDLPQGIVASSMNLGPIIMLTTDHDVTSAPYHRSADALLNGVTRLQATGTELKGWLQDANVDYLLLCDGSDYGEVLTTRLAAGGTVPWATPILESDGPLRLFAVSP